MADVFAEIDEAMRQERMAKFWKDYGAYVLAFIVLTIVGTALYSGYKAWNTAVREEQTSVLIELQRASNYPDNLLEDATLLADMRGSLRGIALLNAGGTFVGSDKVEEALTLYERVAEDASVPAHFRQLGDVMIARLSVDQEGADAAALLARLQAVSDTTDSPWRYHAHLEAAVVEAHLNQDYEAARTHLSVITSSQEELPKSLKDKAAALDHYYSLKLHEDQAS